MKPSALQAEVISFTKLIHLLDSSRELLRISQSRHTSSDILLVGSWLLAFAKNRDEIVERLCVEIERLEGFQSENPGQAPIYILHDTKLYTVRMLVWSPSLAVEGEKQAYTYEKAHNHAFDLLTVGFYGKGYKTKIYTYDFESAVSHPEDLVPLKFVRETVLQEETVLFYEAYRDVHSQHEPEEFSVSLNILVKKPSDELFRQSVFEVQATERERQDGRFFGKPVYNSINKISMQRSLLWALASMRNKKINKVIKRIAEKHPEEEIRALAWAAMIRNEQARLFVENAALDKSTFVRAVAERAMGQFRARRRGYASTDEK
ncbi:hypothetical protein [Pseudomonas aeruginosa]|uniref:hypothetical protein n=1 Tax=Pseudomonas aeruginosa TaxID=287 RepID=UPI0013A57E24|nr:hypothetical protein [Pseudomonas aeruginosa]